MSTEQRRAWASPQQVAEWLQLEGDALQKLRRMRAARTGPPFVKIGAEVRYAWVDVHAWAAARRDRDRG